MFGKGLQIRVMTMGVEPTKTRLESRPLTTSHHLVTATKINNISFAETSI